MAQHCDSVLQNPKPQDSPIFPRKQMNFLNSKQSQSSSPLGKTPQFNLQQAFTNLQNHCSGFFLHHHHQLLNNPFFNPDPSSLITHIESTVSNLRNHAKNAIETGFSSSRFGLGSVSSVNNPVWARIAEKKGAGGGLAMSIEAIEGRFAGVPAYALSNSTGEFVLVSGVDSGKSMGLFCLKQEDAETLLEHMKSVDPQMRPGSKVVPVPLNKVFQLKVDGVAFRLIPELSQIKNAIKERHKAGFSDDSFSGVPVFQSKSLVLRNENKRYRPVFFRMEDLEKSLARTASQQKCLNPSLRGGDIQVAVLEDIIHGMKDNSMATWDDVVFIPPGFDVLTDQSKR